jgi:phosphoglycerate kinase
MADVLPRLEDLPKLRGARVLLRADFNVPLRDGRVEDDLRIVTVLPTLEWLHDQGAAVIACGHLGRPKGRPDPQFSMAPVAERLGALLHRDVPLAPQVVGATAASMAASLGPGDVLMLENLRFEPGETANDPGFAVSLCATADAYVNEAFGASHREHASIVGPPPLLPSAGGRLLLREVEVLSGLLGEPRQPFVAVLGGAKVSDKLGVIRALLDKCETILVGGAMAFTFLVAQGHAVGDSLVEPDWVGECRALLETGRIRVPVDVVVAQDMTADAATRITGAGAIPDGWKGLDIGPESASLFADAIAGAANVLWNGPMGVFELEPFGAGTRGVATAIAGASAYSVAGGGDSLAAVQRYGLQDGFDHLSTGGGASLEFLEGRSLPGIAVLERDA